MPLVLKAFLLTPWGIALVGAAIGSALTMGGHALVKLFASKPALQPLEPLVQDLEDAAVAAEKATLADVAAGKSVDAAKDALDAAKAVGKRSLPDVKTALEGEIDYLTAGPKTTAVIGNDTVNLPVTGTVKKPGQQGIVPLIVILIIGGVMLLGGGITLLATGNGQQDISCLEAAIGGSPVAVGNLVSGLSTHNETAVEGALENFEPSLAKCVLTSLWTDAQAMEARKAALKANAAVVAPAVTIQAQAQVESVKRNWYPPGTVQ
jgi:hypothetical protein